MELDQPIRYNACYGMICAMIEISVESLRPCLNSLLTMILEAIVCCQVTNCRESFRQDVNLNSGEHLSQEPQHLEPER